MATPPISTLDGMRLLTVSYDQLWSDYYALGGNGSIADLRRSVEFGETPTDQEHNLIAHALNERFDDLGQNHPVGYRNLPTAWPSDAGDDSGA